MFIKARSLEALEASMNWASLGLGTVVDNNDDVL